MKMKLTVNGILALPLLTFSSAFAQDTYLDNLYSDVPYLGGGLFEVQSSGVSGERVRSQVESGSWTDNLHFSLSAGVRYDSNIYLTHTDEEDDFIFSVSPTLSYNTGEEGSAVNTLAFTYTPSFRVYASNSDRDTIDQHFSFRYGHEMPKSRLSFTLDYTDTTGSDRFVGNTVSRDSIRGAIGYNYLLTGKTRLDLTVSTTMDLFDDDDLFDRKTYDGRVSLLYQITGKTSIGPSFSYGHTDMSDSRDQDFYEIGVKAEYEVSGKTHLTGTMGYNVMTFDGSNAASDEKNLAWSVAAQYDLSAKTGLSASFYRSPKSSYNFRDAGYVATGVSMSVSHQVSSRMSLYSVLSYENNDYFETGTVGIDLDNDYYTATLGANYQLENGFGMGVNMTWRTNDANEKDNEFDDFTFGINGSYHFR